MLRSRFSWFLVFYYLLNLGVVSQTPQFDAMIPDKIRSIMDPLVGSNNYAGNVLIVRDGSVLFSDAYGMMNEENGIENTSETKYFLASASMIFTSAAIMKLVDEGELSLSDRLSAFYPEVRNSDKISIHHMLAQRSGIPAWDAGLSLANLNRNKPHSIAELIKYFKDDQLLFEPGSSYSHGRSEYILLAGIIEKISGKTFREYLRESVFEPLGMHSSGHYSNETKVEDISNLADGYTEKGFTDVTRAPEIHWSVKTGHASIYSTVGDMRKFAEAVLNKELLSEKSWRAILTDYGENAGYGWFLNPQKDHKRFQMNGRSPGFSSYFGIYPDDDLIVIMLSNRYVSLPFFVGPELAAAALGEEYEILNLSVEDVDRDLAKQISGHYKMGTDFYRPKGTVKIKYSNGKMYSGKYPLIPVLGQDGEITGFIHRHYWSRLEFSTDESGKTVLSFDQFQGLKQGLFSEWKWVIFMSLAALSTLYFIRNRRRKSRQAVASA